LLHSALPGTPADIGSFFFCTIFKLLRILKIGLVNDFIIELFAELKLIGKLLTEDSNFYLDAVKLMQGTQNGIRFFRTTPTSGALLTGIIFY
jgi:hypothetical protein